MAETADLKRIQHDFAAHIRNPDVNPAPAEIEDRRMAIYRELFFSNVSKLLSGTFPVLHKILGKDRWEALIRDYFSRHQSHTPYFLKIPQEFIDFLQDERGQNDADPPFMLELAQYEYIELALSIEETDIDETGVDKNGDPMNAVPVLSPVTQTLAYSYPVHRLSPDFQPDDADDEPTFIIVYRDRSDKVGFIVINAVTALLMERLRHNENKSGKQLLEEIAVEIDHPDPAAVINGGREIFDNLRNRDIVLGVRT